MTEHLWWWGVFFNEEEKAANVPVKFIEDFEQIYEDNGCPKGMCLVRDSQNQYLMLPMDAPTFYVKLHNKGYKAERRMQKFQPAPLTLVFLAGDKSAINNL